MSTAFERTLGPFTGAGIASVGLPGAGAAFAGHLGEGVVFGEDVVVIAAVGIGGAVLLALGPVVLRGALRRHG